MSTTPVPVSAATLALPSIAFAAGATVAPAADDMHSVDVNISPLAERCTLALTVAADSTSLRRTAPTTPCSSSRASCPL
ncbi:hypothetical protein ACWKWN_12790 [Microbacterium trichothecenolyticum]